MDEYQAHHDLNKTSPGPEITVDALDEDMTPGGVINYNDCSRSRELVEHYKPLSPVRLPVHMANLRNRYMHLENHEEFR